MIDELNFDFCDIQIYETYVISRIHEGQTLMPKHNSVMTEISESYFKHKFFFYISHRIHSYAVNPEIYYKTCKIENLKGFAVVSNDYKPRANFQVEKMFITKPFQVFKDLGTAIEWGNTLL